MAIKIPTDTNMIDTIGRGAFNVTFPEFCKIYVDKHGNTKGYAQEKYWYMQKNLAGYLCSGHASMFIEVLQIHYPEH
jgi:hypothetical protein